MHTRRHSTFTRTFAVAGFTAVVAWSAVAIRSQESDDASRVRGLNGQVMQLYGQLQGGAGTRANGLRAQIAALLGRRLATLESLIETSPAEARRLALPADIIADLSAAVPAARGQVESRGAWQGPIEYSIEDGVDFRTHRVIRAMSVGGETLFIQFPGAEPRGLKNGDTLRVEGMRAGSQVVAESSSIVAASGGATAGVATIFGGASTRAKPTPPPPCSTLGAQSAIILLVTMPGAAPPSYVTPASIADVYFHTSTGAGDTTVSLNEDWRETSDGVTSAIGAVAPGPNGGWYTLNQVYDDTQTSQVRAAAIAAADADVDFRQYRRIFIVVNGLTLVSTSPWSGRGTIGCNQLSSADGSFNASTSWIKTFPAENHVRDTFLAAHEGGHNLGLGHSNSQEFGADTIGALGAAGDVDEYNDVFSSMGRHLGHYAAPHKSLLGWLPSRVQTITGSGSYVVQPAEMTRATVQALRIRRGTDNNHFFWVEYRQEVGLYDSRLVYPFSFGSNPFFYLPDADSHVYSGAIIHYEDGTTGNTTRLLDFTPASLPGQGSAIVADDWLDPALAGSWTDPYTGVSITTSNPTGSSLTVDVSYGSGVCVQANPSVALSPSNPSGRRGQNVTFTVTVTNNDSVACSGKTFALSSALPPGWPSSLSSSSMTMPAGLSSTVSITKTIPSNAAYATYAVNASATSGPFVGTGSANITVKPGK